MNKIVYMHISFGHNDAVSFVTYQERAERIAEAIKKGKKTEDFVVLEDCIDISAAFQRTSLHINPEFVQYFVITDNIPDSIRGLAESLHSLLELHHLICFRYGKQD